MAEKETTPKEDTPTVEEQLADLTSKLAGIEDNWKNEQRVSSRKQTEIDALQGRVSEMSSSNEMSQAMLAMVAQQSGRSETEISEEVQANKPDLLKEFRAIQTKAKADRQMEDARKIGESYQRRVEALGLTPKDKAYREIFRDVQSNNLEFADAQITELEAAKVKEVPQGTEEERFTKKLAEEKRKWQEDEGLLSTETGSPNASTLSAQEAMAEYIKGKITAAQAKDRGADFN